MAKNMYQKRKERQLKINEKNDDKGGLQKTDINWYPGHMAKTKREIKENLSLIDIVYELIDARIPFSSKNNDLNELLEKKPRILVMTKMDLCDMEKTQKAYHYYQKMGYNVVMIDSRNSTSIKELLNKTMLISKELDEKRKKQGMKPRKARVLIVGIPNVGKSTLINSLVGRKAVNVGNKPGITKNLSWIRINNDLELLDTPGILWPKMNENDTALNLASMTSIKEEILDNEEIANYVLNKMIKLYPNNLMNRYNLQALDNIIDILDAIAMKIGSCKKKDIDYDRVYQAILRDLRDGYLGKITFDNCN